MPVSSPVLVADIGGTNARFALAHIGASASAVLLPTLTGVRRYKAAEFPAFTDALSHYLREAGPEALHARRAVFAVATAVLGDQIKLTNSPWTFSIEETRRAFGFRQLAVINDFEAIGHAVPRLSAEAFAPVGPGIPAFGPAATTHAVLGPGTGLGVCMLAQRGGGPVIHPSEAGHIGFSPSDALEIEVLRVLMARHGRVSNERLISGPGLAALHDALCEIEGLPPPGLTPEAITAAADAAPQGRESRTLSLFCSLYGSIAGDLVLAFGAWSGAVMVGRLSNLLLPALRNGGFRQRFEDKGRFAPAMQGVPSAVVTEHQVGLMGAGIFAAIALGNGCENG